jgi:hypothetical protein
METKYPIPASLMPPQCAPAADSCLKRSLWWSGRRRFLQSFRKALSAGTDAAQIIEGVNSGVVAVIPGESKRVVTHEREVVSLQMGRNTPLPDHAPARELLDTQGTRAVLTEIPGRIGTEMSVIPGNVCQHITYSLDPRRHQIWQCAFLPSNQTIFIPQPVPCRLRSRHGAPESTGKTRQPVVKLQGVTRMGLARRDPGARRSRSRNRARHRMLRMREHDRPPSSTEKPALGSLLYFLQPPAYTFAPEFNFHCRAMVNLPNPMHHAINSERSRLSTDPRWSDTPWSSVSIEGRCSRPRGIFRARGSGCMQRRPHHRRRIGMVRGR